MSSRNYWAFCANPRKYRIEAAVQELKEDNWTVPRGNVLCGDRAIIWKTKGNDQHRGIIALAEILTNPAPSIDSNIDYWVDRHTINETIDRVKVRYVVPLSLPLWEDETSPLVLKELSVARATGGTIFHVTLAQWDAIMTAIGGWPTQSPEIDDTELVIAEFAGKRAGQRFLTDVAERRAIELYAMHTAEIYFKKQGWVVSDISATRPYDFLCIGDIGEELHVEVKGTTSDGKQILLTANEVKHARNHYPQTALFIVSHIQVDQASSKEFQASGGEVRLIEPWDVDEGILTSLAFSYICPRKA